jgi:hypothetical protein
VGILLIIGVAMCAKRYGVKRCYYIIIIMCIGYATYIGNMKIYAGGYFEGINSQRHYYKRPKIENLCKPHELLRNLLTVNHTVLGENAILNRIFFIVSILGALHLPRQGWCFALMIAPQIYIAAAATMFVSYMRFTLVMLPLYWVFGAAMEKQFKLRKWICVCAVILSNALQLQELWKYVNLENYS